MRARWEHVTLEAVAGRGAFGTVLAGAWRPPGARARAVAVKALQPVPPPRAQHRHAYKVTVLRTGCRQIANSSFFTCFCLVSLVQMFLCMASKLAIN